MFEVHCFWLNHCHMLLLLVALTSDVVDHFSHTSRFLTIWLAFLPLSLYSTCGWATVPSAVIIAFLLLGIEEIGVSVEEPFSILPLGAHPLSYWESECLTSSPATWGCAFGGLSVGVPVGFKWDKGKSDASWFR